MASASVQFSSAKYGVPSGMDMSNVRGMDSYFDMSAESRTNDMPLAHQASTVGSVAAATTWRAKHIGFKGFQKMNTGSLVNFNTQQVDPSVR